MYQRHINVEDTFVFPWVLNRLDVDRRILKIGPGPGIMGSAALASATHLAPAWALPASSSGGTRYVIPLFSCETG